MWSSRATGHCSIPSVPDHRCTAGLTETTTQRQKSATEETMVDRRTFTTLLAAGLAAPSVSFAQSSKAKNVFYASAGPELTLYSVDVDEAALVKRDTVSLPANIQYAWPHPSKRYLYVVSSNGGSCSTRAAGG